MSGILDIKDFQKYSNVSDTDRFLLVKGQTDTAASIDFALFKSVILGLVKPEIINGIWYIGGVSTGVNSGLTPQLRYGSNGIEYRYLDTDEWAVLVTLNTLQQPAVDIANELKEHPCKVSENYTWLVWDAVDKVYIDTKISARGRSPIIRDMIWWVWDEDAGDYISTGQSANSDFILTKEAVEGVFTGNVVGHHHLEYTIPTLDSMPTSSTLTWNDSDNNVYQFYVGQLCRVPDPDSDNGYKFFQLYDINGGNAVWGEISGKGGVGQEYKGSENGEIFNDYDNNIALGNYSHAEGSGRKNSISLKIFNINESTAQYYDYPSNFKPRVGDIHEIDGKLYKVVISDMGNSTVINDDEEFESALISYSPVPQFDKSITEIFDVKGVAYDNYSHKEGYCNNSSGIASHSEGKYNTSVGDSSHTEGYQTYANGSRAHAEGYKTTVIAADGHAEGRETWCLGGQGHVQGFLGICYGGYSHTEGGIEQTFEVSGKKLINKEEEVRNFFNLYTTQTTVGSSSYWKINSDFYDNYYAHGSFGNGTHAEGINNIVCDKAGHVEGYTNVCGDMIPGHGQDSRVYAPHAEGVNNRIESLLYAPHVGGGYNHIKSGNYTFAHGYYLSVENDYEASFGKYNSSLINGKKVLFSYGIGTGEENRKNAFSILEDGTVVAPVLENENLTKEIEEFKLEVNSKIDNAISNLNKIVEEQNTKIEELLALIQGGGGVGKAFVTGDTLVFTSMVNANVDAETLSITDELITVEDNMLTIK